MGELSQHNVVLQAEPGAGKSTVLPLSLLDSRWLKGKKIIMLEPRRVAVKSIAYYLADKLGEKVGERIGYQVKNDRNISEDTVLEIVTEGILIRRLQNDPELKGIGLVIFDEFHLRSIQSDLSLMLSLEVQQTIRDDLKLLVMSATIDTGMISRYMGGAKVIECSGRTFPVSVSYAVPNKNSIVTQVSEALNIVLKGNTSGDVLVFLSGQADINRCISKAKETVDTNTDLLFLPLYGSLTLAQQEKALVPDPLGKRRIIFATNIAETSLTIECVTCVIDSGLEKILVYDPISGMTRFETQFISKASAEQRKGRAGRTQAGQCIRLWDEHKHRSLNDFQLEEVLSADLTSMLLELYQWGIGCYEDVYWLTPPPKPNYESAKKTLVILGMIDIENKLTDLAHQALGLGLSPRLSAMLLQAQGATEQGIACDLAALLSNKDIFHNGSGVDITDRLLAVQAYKYDRKSAFNSYPLKRSGVEQLIVSSVKYRRRLKLDERVPIFSLADLQGLVGKLLLYAYPDRLAKKRTHSDGRYQLSNGRGVFLFEDDPLFGSDWLVVADCDAKKEGGRIYSANSISTESVFDSLDEKIEERDSFVFDVTKRTIIGRKIKEYGALELSYKSLTRIPSEVFQNCLQQVVKDNFFDVFNWTNQCEGFVSRAKWLGEYMDSFPKISKENIINTLDQWLLPYLSNVDSIQALRKLNIFDLLLGDMSWDDRQTLSKEAPEKFTTPSNKILPIIYDEQKGPTVSVQLQEMFGQVDSPMIGGGRVAIRFELLSPALRPIQTTSDLRNFWRTSYFDVAKDMRGKYPKHRWPDKPMLEKPGRSIKM